jgi:hypothetical protein
MIWSFIKNVYRHWRRKPAVPFESSKESPVLSLAQYRYERRVKHLKETRMFAYEEARAACFRRRKVEHERRIDDEASRGYLYWSLFSPRDK